MSFLSRFSRTVTQFSRMQLQAQTVRSLSLTNVQNLRSPRVPTDSSQFSTSMNPDQEVLVDRNSEDCEQTKEIWDKVNQQIKDKSHGRLFAVVHVAHHQHKVTEGDLLMVLRDLGASVGQRIRIDKNLLVGSKDFTLIGRPLLPRDLVNVEATVVEKDLSHKKVIYRTYTKRKIKKANFKREFTTTLRINKIELLNPVNETSERGGFEKPRSADPLGYFK